MSTVQSQTERRDAVKLVLLPIILFRKLFMFSISWSTCGLWWIEDSFIKHFAIFHISIISNKELFGLQIILLFLNVVFARVKQ